MSAPKSVEKMSPGEMRAELVSLLADAYFVTLDAQRESAECYIKSQEAEGWVCLQEHYNDGGYTGGNMERPALKRLLSDIEAGKSTVLLSTKSIASADRRWTLPRCWRSSNESESPSSALHSSSTRRTRWDD